jgi:hypothetical protein
MLSKRTLPNWDWVELHPMISAARVRAYATRRAASWNRFNSCSATLQYRQQSDTLDANNASAERLTTRSALSRTIDRVVRSWPLGSRNVLLLISCRWQCHKDALPTAQLEDAILICSIRGSVPLK